MILLDPCLALCTNRSAKAKTNKLYGEPTDWLSPSALRKHALHALTFDFFVNWSNATISNEIWVKKIMAPGCAYQEVKRSYQEIFLSDIGFEKIRDLYHFSNRYNLVSAFVIFDDDQDWAAPDSTLLLAYIRGVSTTDFTIQFEEISILTFQAKIRKLSGGPVSIGTKGLIYGTSSLECHLSKTDSLYPGDVDFLLLDNSQKPLAILEFKKHTLSTSISHQKLSNYYPSPDARKYDRLAIFRDYIGKEVPILNLYFPTNETFTDGRLELLTGSNGNLGSRAASNFTLATVSEQDDALINKVLKAIKYHYSPK